MFFQILYVFEPCVCRMMMRCNLTQQFVLILEDFYHSVLGDREKTRKTFRNLTNHKSADAMRDKKPLNLNLFFFFVSQATQANSSSSTKIKLSLSTLRLDAKGSRCRQCLSFGRVGQLVGVLGSTIGAYWITLITISIHFLFFLLRSPEFLLNLD